jgi:TetR/AcrR family transcriptional regulator, regulator of cefoperazone and chloramphenicol sensitivity
MRSAPAAADLTSSARIRETAMALFARSGVAGTSLRAVARAAGVSPALVVHHFGSKDGLREAVDKAVVARFTDRLHSVPLDDADQLERRGRLLADLIREEPLLCDYIARALAEGTEPSADLFRRLFAAARADEGLVAAGAIRPGTDPEWRALHQLMLVVGPLILRPLVERELGASLYAPESIERWMGSTIDLLRRGIYAR